MVAEKISHKLVDADASSYWSLTTSGDRHAFGEEIAAQMQEHVETLINWNRSDFEKRNAKLGPDVKTKVWLRPDGEIKEIRVNDLKVKRVSDEHKKAVKTLVQVAKAEKRAQELKRRTPLGALWPNFSSLPASRRSSNRSSGRTSGRTKLSHIEKSDRINRINDPDGYNNNNEYEPKRKVKEKAQVSKLVQENKKLREQLGIYIKGTLTQQKLSQKYAAENAQLKAQSQVKSVPRSEAKIATLEKEVRKLQALVKEAREAARAEKKDRQGYAFLMHVGEREFEELELKHKNLLYEFERSQKKIRALQSENNDLRPDAKAYPEMKRYAGEADEWALKLHRQVLELREEIGGLQAQSQEYERWLWAAKEEIEGLRGSE